jgi:PAS domain S-box-containing protein
MRRRRSARPPRPVVDLPMTLDDMTSERVSDVLDTVPAFVMLTDAVGEPFYVNRPALQFLGLSLQEVIGSKYGFVHPEDAAAAETDWTRSVTEGIRYCRTQRLRRADGAYRWFQVEGTPVFGADGEIRRWCGVWTDVHERVVAERGLRERERELQLLVDTIPAMCAVTSASGEVEYVSQPALDIIGVTLEAFRGTTWKELIHPEDANTLVEKWLTAVRTGVPLDAEYRQRYANGSYHWWHHRAQPLRDPEGKILRWYGISTIIDDRRFAESALRDREQRYRQILDAIPALVFCARADGSPSYLNRGTLQYTGVAIDRLAEYTYVIVHPDDIPRVEAQWSECIRTGLPYNITHRVRSADGSYRWFQIRAEPLRDDAGNVREWFGVSTDIDDLRRAEMALRETEQRLRLIIDTIPALVWCTAPDGTPIYLNKRVMDYTGVTLSRYEDYNWTSTMHPEDIQRTSIALGDALRSGTPFRITHRLRRADGEYRWMETRGDPLRDERGHILCWYGIDVDVTTRIDLEEAVRKSKADLARASEIAMVAELSASLAHEINQPLTALVSNGTACQRWLAMEPPNLERAKLTSERIMRDATSVAEIVNRIRQLFRRSPPARAPMNLNEVITETLDLLADVLRTNRVRVQRSLSPSLPLVFADRIQIQQVLVNLSTNAIDAMSAVAGLTPVIEVRSGTPDAQTVSVEISDVGPGLTDPERIFQPFFTTKKHGMGMGLAICRSIVEAHGGILHGKANPSRGTTFEFRIPSYRGN